MEVQEVPCFAVLPSTEVDDEDGFFPGVLGQPHGSPLDRHDVGLPGLTHQSWHWLGQNLRLQVRPCQGEGGADLIGWLNNRSQSPLANYHLARCPTRVGCLKCEAAKKVTCGALNQALCLSCREGLPLYCIGLDSPLLCPKWGKLEVKEYKSRQDFFKQRQSTKPPAMSTRTVQLTNQVRSPEAPSVPSHPVSRLKKGFGRLVGRAAKDGGQPSRDGAVSTLADDLGSLGLGASSNSAPKPARPVSLEEELAAHDESRRSQFKGRYVGTGVRGNGGGQWRAQLSRTVGQDSLMVSADEVSDWEEGYTANLGGGRCPIDRHHCVSTPSSPDNQDQRFDTHYGGPDLSAVDYGLDDLRGAAGPAAQHLHPGVEPEGSGPSRGRNPRHVRFGMSATLGAAGAPRTAAGGRASPLPSADSARPDGRMNQSAPATRGGGGWLPGRVGEGGVGGPVSRETFGGARPKDMPRVAQPHGPGRRPSRIPTEPSSRANQSASIGRMAGARGLDDVGSEMAGGHAGMEAPDPLLGDPLLGDPLQVAQQHAEAQRLGLEQLGLGFSAPSTPNVGGARQDRDEHRDADRRDGNQRDNNRRDDGHHERERRDGRDHDRSRRGGSRRHNDDRRRGPRRSGGGGDDDDDYGDNEEEESSSSNDSFLRRRRRRGMEREDGNLSNALNMIVDRLENMSTSGGRGSAKQKPVTIPAIVRQPDGSISALGFYQWVMLLTRLVDDLRLDKSFVLLTICTDSKILPQSWRQACLGCQSLGEAITRLSDLNPPLDSTFPLLVAQLTGLDPTDGSHEQVIERAGELLASLSLLRALHPLKDLTREQSLACVFSLGSSLELQAGVMELVGEMDYLKQLPPGDGQHQSYTVSLINYLERQRKLRVDIVASVECGKWNKPGLNPSLPSYAQPLVPAKGGRGEVGGRGAARGGRGAQGARGARSAQSAQGDPRTVGKAKSPKKCGFSCGQPHNTWDCPKTLDVRLKKIPIPPSVCKKCCNSIESGVLHKPECHIYQWTKKDGKAFRIDRLCPIHKGNSCHALLCTSCGKDPQLSAPVPVMPSRATPLMPSQSALAGGQPGGSGVAKIPSVVFMSEILMLEAADGSSLKVVTHYDSLSGCSFAHNIPGSFNHGPSDLVSEVFNLSTFMGEENYSLPVMTLKVISPGRGAKVTTPVTCFVSEYPAIPPTNLPVSLGHMKFGNVSPTEQDGCSARVMIGAEYSALFPTPVKTPRSIRRTYSGITAFRSQLSGQILLAGQLSREHLKQGRSALPMFVTVPNVLECPPCGVGTNQEDDEVVQDGLGANPSSSPGPARD